MAKDLTQSSIERQNILNNNYALSEIETASGVQGIEFQGEIWLLKDQVAQFFQIDIRTIERYLSEYEEELANSGYQVLRDKSLAELKLAVESQGVADIYVGRSVSQLGVFNFRAFLNLAMLLVESDTARVLRQMILDITIDTINARTGGGTKYINQRDEDFVISMFKGENYRQEFTNALDYYLDMGKFKYPLFTDKVYKSIFCEKSKEYRKILKLKAKDRVRDTFYSEILDLISSFEYGYAEKLKEEFNKLGRKLSYQEANELYGEFESQPLWKPLLENARNKMASRDLCFRDALHEKLSGYITPVNPDEFERFLGEKSKELAERLDEAQDVLKRLKERE